MNLQRGYFIVNIKNIFSIKDLQNIRNVLLLKDKKLENLFQKKKKKKKLEKKFLARA